MTCLSFVYLIIIESFNIYLEKNLSLLIAFKNADKPTKCSIMSTQSTMIKHYNRKIKPYKICK